MLEGSLEVRHNMDRWKSRAGKSQFRTEQNRREEARSKKQEARSKKQEARSKKQEARRSEKRRSQKKDAGARKGRQVAKHCVSNGIPMVCGSGGSKSRLAKVAGAEPSGQMRSEKLHAVVAPSTCRSKDAQNTPTLEHSWKLWCGKSARRCGAEHMWKEKV